MPRLLIRLPLMAGESVVSFMQRHAQANRAPRMVHMLRLLEQVCGEKLKDVRDLTHSRAALRAVEWLTGLADGELESQRLERLYPAYLVTETHTWERWARFASRQAVCPACLDEAGYGHASWEFVQAPVCLVHGTALLEHCPSCAAPLRHNRTRLKLCEACGADLAKARPPAVTAPALRVVRLIQRPSMAHMGSAESTAPIDQLDLSRLLRLCVFPGPGRVSTYGLTDSLNSFSVEERIAALDRLGSAFIGRRIDCALLRSIVLQRWPGANLLPEESALVIIQAAAQLVELHPEVVALLCFGDVQNGSQSAAEFFSGRPPYLPAADDVARFLGVDLHVLSQLAMRHGLQQAGRGQGHDMDEVLSLKRQLNALCEPQLLDDALGWNGLTAALVDLKLLTGLRDAGGKLLGVEPHSFAMLVSRIQSVMAESPRCEGDGVPLSDASRYGMDTNGTAWAVAQVVGGSLAAFDWPQPCRLTDLVVDGQRLRALAGETSRDRLPE